MSFFDLFLIALALSMDAFAVAICKGLSVKKVGAKHILTVGIYFGGFQALMPLIGFLLGFKFERFIVSIDHWIAFVLLAVIGGGMIREALAGKDDEANDSFSFKTMLPLALATSIDALAVGISFAFLGVDIVAAAVLIGVTTFVLSGAGVVVGNVFGAKYKSKAELAGGIVLILIGLKILLEHLGVVSF
ncbi:MAG: manganese efflux pump MntP family protein [Oscillospiraceae bacterium]